MVVVEEVSDAAVGETQPTGLAVQDEEKPIHLEESKLVGNEQQRNEETLVRAENKKRLGNDLLSKGDYADACLCYSEGLQELSVTVDQPLVIEIRLALHLNAALAHLRRGNLASAVDHASEALAIDPKSTKALYRRGMARLSLSEHSGHKEDASAARADLESVLEADPANAEVREKVVKLRAAARVKDRSDQEAQRQTFKNMFSGSKPLYEKTPPQDVQPVLRDLGNRAHELTLSTERVSFHYERNVPILIDVNLELRAGSVMGVFGENAAGKSTLARILCDKLSPVQGQVVHHGVFPPTSLFGDGLKAGLYGMTGVLVAVLAVVSAVTWKNIHAQWSGNFKRQVLILSAVMSVAVFLIIVAISAFYIRRRSKRIVRHETVFITSESSHKEAIPQGQKIEHVIGETIPGTLSAAERREQVIRLLSAAGFQMYNQTTGEPVGNPQEYIDQGLQFGQLSGGQMHLIYVLRQLARRPKVLICDEMLGGLDAYRQPRVLRMLKRIRNETDAATLFITTELHQLRIIADSIAFMSRGTVTEQGSAEDVLDFPKHPDTKSYVSNFRGLPGGSVIGGKLAQNYGAIEKDQAIAGPWL